jgi:hypothetical protein
MKFTVRVLVLAAAVLAWTALVGRVASAPTSIAFRALTPAAWLFNGVPVEATYLPTPFKSIQAVSVTISSGTSNYATLSPAVNLANTILVYGGQTSNDTSGFHNGSGWAYCTPSSSTTVSCYRYVAGATVTVNVTAIEFASGLLRSATRCGAITMSGLTGTAVLSPPVVVAKSVATMTGIADPYVTAASTADNDVLVRLSLAAGVITATKTGGGAYNNAVGYCVAEGK